MTVSYYRTNDLTRWGSGMGRDLLPVEVDLNFWGLDQRVNVLEARPLPTTFEDFEVTGTSLYIHLSNSTIFGPYELPVARYNPTGDWVAEFPYEAMDTFRANGILYEVLLPHTSAETFSAGATDGSGNNYYSVILESPGNSMPTGGAAGMKLSKSTNVDFAVTWTWTFPTGTGNAGKYLRQKSNTQDDVEFATPDASEIDFTPVTGSSLAAYETVDEALEALASGTPIDPEGIPFTPVSGNGMVSNNVQDAINELATSGGAGRQTIWMPAAGMTPLLTNGADAGLFETASDNMVVKTLNFDPTTDEGAQFEIAMPKSWDKGSLKFKLFWSHATSVANFGVAWQVFAATIPATGGAAGNLDSFPDGQIGVTSTGGTEDSLYSTDESDPLEVLNNYTGLTPSDGEMLYIQVWRNPDDAADTMAVDARLHGMQIFYTTNAGSDD